MKNVQVNAKALRSGDGDDNVIVDFTGGHDDFSFKGEIVHSDLGQLKMPTEVWEFFKAALMMLNRSQSEDYFFETGLDYRQPRDDKYPDQHCLEIDSSILSEEGLNTVRIGDRHGPKATPGKPEPQSVRKDLELGHLEVMDYGEGRLRFIADDPMGTYLEADQADALLRWLSDRARPAEEQKEPELKKQDIYHQAKDCAKRLNETLPPVTGFWTPCADLELLKQGGVVFDPSTKQYALDHDRLLEILRQQAKEATP